ncbi:MAG: response regulator transcription factor [Rhodospirillales bacterium]
METPTKVVLVDDDDLFRESLERNLVDAGFDVVGFGDGMSALSYLSAAEAADVVLLDWKMPVMNGIEVLRRLTGLNREIPVIFLTVLSDQIYEEAALLTGAVDFVEKSRSFSILLRRIELILGGTRAKASRAGATPESDLLRRGRLELHLDISRAFWNGKQVDLTVTEFKLVHCLAERVGRDVRYRELYDLVRGPGFLAGDGIEGYRANIRTFVKRIRQKFRDIDGEFGQIENFPGFGYRWMNEEPDDG